MRCPAARYRRKCYACLLAMSTCCIQTLTQLFSLSSLLNYRDQVRHLNPLLVLLVSYGSLGAHLSGQRLTHSDSLVALSWKPN